MTADPIRLALTRGLLKGLGYEDVAVREGVNVELFRREFKRMERSGALREIAVQARRKAE
jgi:hypothetical protein